MQSRCPFPPLSIKALSRSPHRCSATLSMARKHRRSRSSRSKSPSFSPDRRRGDDIEAQMSAVNSPNTGSRQGAPSISSTKSSGHSTSDDVPDGASFDAAPSPGNHARDDRKVQSNTSAARIVSEGDPLQATNPVFSPLPAPVEDLSRRRSHDSEPASSGSGLHTAVQGNEATPVLKHTSNKRPAMDENPGATIREDAAVSTRSLLPGAPDTGRKEEQKSEPTGETSDTWSKCAEAAWQREKTRLDNLKESINYLLLFVSLFLRWSLRGLFQSVVML